MPAYADPSLYDWLFQQREFLLMDVLHRSYTQSQSIASIAVVVDAKDDRAVRFYERYGFIRFPEQPHRLFLPMKTIAKLLG